MVAVACVPALLALAGLVAPVLAALADSDPAALADSDPAAARGGPVAMDGPEVTGGQAVGILMVADALVEADVAPEAHMVVAMARDHQLPRAPRRSPSNRVAQSRFRHN